MALLPACAFCVDKRVNPLAADHVAYCAEYITRGLLEQAEARCQLAIEYGPHYAEPRNLMGQIAVARGQYELATDWFKEAIALRDDFAEAHNNLGFIFEHRRDYNAAADAFLEALEVDPGYQVARRNYATMLMYLDREEDARAEYLKCLEIDPTYCDCRLGLGALDLTRENWEAAVGQFGRLTEVCPDLASGWYNLCYAHLRMSRCDRAVDACLSAVAIDNEYLEARENLGHAYSCLAQQDEVLQQLVEQINANPGDPQPHFKLCTLYEDKKLYDRALTECNNAIRLNQKHKLAHYRSARMNDQLLRTDETIDMCQKFVDLLRGDEYPRQRKWCVGRVRELQFR